MAINFGNLGKVGSYESYADNMVRNLVQIINDNDINGKKNNNINAMEYHLSDDNTMKIKVCPEPSIFLKDITKEDTSIKRQEAFLKYISDIENINVKKPEDDIWFNKTSNGINIRLGNVNGDTGNQEPATLGDDCVHGVVVGRTGSGKSVLINNIILNFTTEYSPWELDLYLVDMKKVELSRYMANDKSDGKFMTPHVSACAATSEVRYVVSMIQYLADCMKARQSLFAALGVQKINDFREKYSKELGVDFVLPRILLLVDEFQQLFLEASSKERKILDECITAITKLGRATGVHLLFASQEMSGALGSKELANFKLRIALPCDAAISKQILGNTAASKLDEKGTTLINKNGGSKEEDNITYKTPFVNDKEEDDGSESEFLRYLIKIHDAAKENNFSKVQKFYQEDTQEKINKIETLKKSKIIENQVIKYKRHNTALIDALILGTGVLYTNKKNDYESFFIEKGKKRNIGIICAKDSDIGNTIKTLADNFRFSNVDYEHTVIFESEILRSVYPELINDLNQFKKCAHEVNYQEYQQLEKKNFNTIVSRLDFSHTIKDIMKQFICSIIGEMDKKDFEECVPTEKKKYINVKTIVNQTDTILSELKEIDINNPLADILKYLIQKCENFKNLLEDSKMDSNNIDNKNVSNVENLRSENVVVLILLKLLIKFKVDSKYTDEKYVATYNVITKSKLAGKYEGPIKVTWIIGSDNLDKAEDKYLSKRMENCTNMGEIYILAGSNPENIEMAYRCCNYMFVNSPDERIYTKYKMNFTKKSDDNKTMEFKIINYNQERSYKQFSYDCKVENAPKLDFDGIEV